MIRLVTTTLVLGLASSSVLAERFAMPKKVSVYKTAHIARLHCPGDRIVWADTSSHKLYLPGDNHYGHTRGGYACESEARGFGYRGPMSHG
jgi:hypothetical protein